MAKQTKQKPQRSANFADREKQEQKRINILSEILHLNKPYEEAHVPNEDRKGTKRYPCRWFANHTLELSFGFNQTASDSIQYPILFQLRSTKSLEDRKGVLGLYLKNKVQSDLLGKSVASKTGKQKVGTARTEGYFDLQGFDIDWNHPDRWNTSVWNWYDSFCQKLDSISFEDKVVGEFNEKQTDKLEDYFQRITTTSQTHSRRGESGRIDHGKNGASDSMKTEIKDLLLSNHQVILTGAPGTGKTYLAHQVAEAMVVEDLPKDASDEDKEKARKERIKSVQFHPNYDYSDFVEGFKPKSTPNANGTIEFELKEGVFKCFAGQALENFQKSQKSKEDIDKEQQVADLMPHYLSDAITSGKVFKTIRSNRFKITYFDGSTVWIEVPDNPKANALTLKNHVLLKMLLFPKGFKNVKEVSTFLERPSSWWEDSYYFAIWKEMHELLAKSKPHASNNAAVPERKKRFVFIIDEINRADLSRVFGELFSLLEEDYRYPKNLKGITLPSGEKFHIPENLYIIGTMNDIDRSVESMDFALRRRFAWKEVTAEESKQIIKEKKIAESDKKHLEKAMDALNALIAPKEGTEIKSKAEKTPDLRLGSEYQLGGAIFAKLEKYVRRDKDGNPEEADAEVYKQLWDNHIENILREYLRGRSKRDEELKALKESYNTALPNELRGKDYRDPPKDDGDGDAGN